MFSMYHYLWLRALFARGPWGGPGSVGSHKEATIRLGNVNRWYVLISKIYFTTYSTGCPKTRSQ